MVDVSLGLGMAISSVSLAVPATVKIIVSSRRPQKDDSGTNEVLLKVIQKLQETMEVRVAADKERSKSDYEMLTNLIEMNTTAKSSHNKINDTLDISKMTEKNTKDLTNDSDKIKEIVSEIRITQKSIDKRLK